MNHYRGFSVGLLFLSVCCSSVAWEPDLHYGLTKWVAFNAGFSLQDAEIIARGTQAPDEGKLYPAPSAVIEGACFGHRDDDLIKLVQRYHFASYGPVPGSPSARKVAPGSPAAMSLAEKEIQTVLPTQPREKTLEDLGVALHPVEDSWAHQGEPGIPWTCWKDLAYGHPATRGGWRKHDADLTYLHEAPDTLETARRSYDVLEAFLKTHASMRAHPATPWSKLEPQVQEFARARSKQEKSDWFRKQKQVPLSSYTSHPDFLQHINLPDSAPTRHSRLLPAFENVSAASQDTRQIQVPNDAREFVEQFLNTWIVERSPERALEFVDVEQFGKAFSPSKTASGSVLARSVLDMWLVRDHGQVNLMGHGVENTDDVIEFRKYPQIEAASLRDAIYATGERPYDLIPVTAEKSVEQSQHPDAYAVVFQFKHAPRDAVVLLVTRDVQRGWIVSGLMWWIL